MWAHCYIFLLFFSLPPRVSVLPMPTREQALWREEKIPAGKPRLEAWVFTPESSRPWGAREGVRAGGGAGPAEPAQGRASTPAGADADPPESTVVIHRPFSEIALNWGRSTEPGIRELLPGAGILGGHPRGYSAPPGAAVSTQGTGTYTRPSVTEAFSAKKCF